MAKQALTAQQVKTVADARKIVEDRKLETIKLGVFDMDGVFRGKYVSKDKFFSALDGGFGFCDVVLGWDSNDELYDNVSFTGWHTAYPDAWARVVPDTCRELPFENTLLFICEFVGTAEEICPRGTLRRILSKLAKKGLSAYAACEYEFFVFEETPHSVRAKNYQNLTNITPGSFGYSVLRSSVHADFYHELLGMCRVMDMPIEGLHTETGPGVLEAAIGVDEALRAADKAALFKTFTKVLAQKHGWMATFMAKWSPDWPGQSGHMHTSLKGKGDKALFHDPKKPHNISDAMRHYIGGQQALLPDLTAMIAPTVNSYSRLIPGFWAPTNATWGVENRTCALRAIPGSPKSQRVEYRISAADVNPYIGLAAAIGSGLWGMEQKIEPDAPLVGNAYEAKIPAKRHLPQTLMEAAGRMKKSAPARALFGDAFVEHFSATREWEERAFRKAITDWELKRYFEII